MSVAAAIAESHAGAAPVRSRVALCFALRDDLRFLSHQDESRMLVRAMRRADWPLAYSLGFNPQPYVSLPLPRSVGIGSECEWAWVDLSTALEARVLFERLAPVMPASAPLLRVVSPVRRGAPQARKVRYEIALPEIAAEELDERIVNLMSLPRLIVQRDHGPKRPPRPIDLSTFIGQLEFKEGVLHMALLVDQQQTARPAEILKELNLPAEALQTRVRRVWVEWDSEAPAEHGWPFSERKNFGNEEDSEKDKDDT